MPFGKALKQDTRRDMWGVKVHTGYAKASLTCTQWSRALCARRTGKIRDRNTRGWPKRPKPHSASCHRASIDYVYSPLKFTQSICITGFEYYTLKLLCKRFRLLPDYRQVSIWPWQSSGLWLVKFNLAWFITLYPRVYSAQWLDKSNPARWDNVCIGVCVCTCPCMRTQVYVPMKVFVYMCIIFPSVYTPLIEATEEIYTTAGIPPCRASTYYGIRPHVTSCLSEIMTNAVPSKG